MVQLIVENDTFPTACEYDHKSNNVFVVHGDIVDFGK